MTTPGDAPTDNSGPWVRTLRWVAGDPPLQRLVVITGHVEVSDFVGDSYVLHSTPLGTQDDTVQTITPTEFEDLCLKEIFVSVYSMDTQRSQDETQDGVDPEGHVTPGTA